MAEHLFEKMLLDYKLEDQVQARSAGISPFQELIGYVIIL